ncbi:MAG: lytic murein transglycosylase B [Gammaproteobacteria bacterium]|nr:MAG: lytic murein transglycosylase B [Gammaproteobacteria bacterium]
MFICRFYFLLLTVLLASPATAWALDVDDYPVVQSFIARMIQLHGFTSEELYDWFEHTEIRPKVLKSINQPKEAAPWYVYRQQFVTHPSARRGAHFWRKHEKIFTRAEKEYGVDAAVIIAILGVETQYGRSTGGHPTMAALTTLMLDYPKRSAFFGKELEQLLLLAKELDISPLALKGSYAGAVGYPQFLPSSYRHYAVDYDEDGRKDLIHSVADTIGSVANYFHIHGWKMAAPIVDEVQIESPVHEWFTKLDIKPKLSIKHFTDYGIFPTRVNDSTLLAALIKLQGQKAPIYRFGFHNFYVITRYNKSSNYAMAVYELSELIKKARTTQES